MWRHAAVFPLSLIHDSWRLTGGTELKWLWCSYHNYLSNDLKTSMCQNRIFEIDMCNEQHIVAKINTEVLYGVARCYGAAANLCKSVTRDVCKVSSCSNKHTLAGLYLCLTEDHYGGSTIILLWPGLPHNCALIPERCLWCL